MSRIHNKENASAVIFAIGFGLSFMFRVIPFEFELINTAEAETFEQYAFKVAPKYGVAQEELAVLLEKESNIHGMAAQRYEPHIMKKALKHTRNKTQARMLSSSHCRMQVLGTTAKTYGVNWNELYQPKTCAEVGIAYFAKQKLRCKKKHKSKRKVLYCAAKRYNGGHSYARDFVKRLGL